MAAEKIGGAIVSDSPLLAEAEPWRRYGVALLCLLFSLPWHYILWLSLYKIVRYRDPPTTEAVYVLAAVGVAAYALSRWAYLLFRGPRPGAGALLSNPLLWVAALLFGALAVFTAVTSPDKFRAALHLGGLALAAGSLAIFRRRNPAQK